MDHQPGWRKVTRCTRECAGDSGAPRLDQAVVPDILEFGTCMKYFSAVEYFPHTQPELWSRDGVHLSDDQGMGILVQLLWSAAMKEFETPPPAPRVSPRPSPPVRNLSPKLVVTGEAPAPRSPDPFQWQLASHGHKVIVTV
ncbi:hypothetical protein N1851_002389 [Merluccius polli]|uniref:Uncharacterized protein n=1 Tax=Merluccius polli TaxID=89951 RepID=A0AA47PB22_MERPO|nr:hypothetical protein N1851_002389 [Merluccius polli]